MHALITNDDGVDSPGLHALARAALHLGLDVTVAAPGWDSSGASASLTAVEHDGRVLLSPRDIGGLAAANLRVLALEAAPAFIARLGVSGGLGPLPDLVLSGINRGANAGQAVLHSGTVGAALTARTHGCSAIAFSLDVDSDGAPRWDTAQAVAEHVIGWALAAEGPLVLNVNVPNLPLDEVRGLRRGQLASFGAVQTTITESGQGYLRVAYKQPDAEAEEGSDAALLADGYASYTALRPVCEDAGTDATGLGWEPASTAATGPGSRSG